MYASGSNHFQLTLVSYALNSIAPWIVPFSPEYHDGHESLAQPFGFGWWTITATSYEGISCAVHAFRLLYHSVASDQVASSRRFDLLQRCISVELRMDAMTVLQ